MALVLPRLVSLVAVGAMVGLPAAAYASNGNANGKQTICHATNSNTNPYVVITPNKNGDVDGHAKHTGPIWDSSLKAQHISWGDIIPPFDYNNHGTPAHFPGLNWTAAGQAIFNNGCKVPTTGGGGGGGTTTTGGEGGTTSGGGGGGGTTTTGGEGGTTSGGGGGAGTTTGSITGGGSGAVVTPLAGRPVSGGGGGTVLTPTRPVSRGGRSTLPFTGAPVGDESVAALAMLTIGAGLVFGARRRRSA